MDASDIDDQVLFSRWEPEQLFAAKPCLSSSYAQAQNAQNLFTTSHSSPLPYPSATEGFPVSAEHLPHGSLHALNTTAGRNIDFSMASESVPCQSQWNEMGPGLASGSRAHAPHWQLQSQHHMPHGIHCGQYRDLEPSSITPAIPSIPQSVSPGLASTPSYSNTQFDAYTSHILDSSNMGQDTYANSTPDGDENLSISGFLSAFANYDSHSDAGADPQPYIDQYNINTRIPHALNVGGQDIPTSSPDGDTVLSASGFLRDHTNYNFHLNTCANPQLPITASDAQMAYVPDASVGQDKLAATTTLSSDSSFLRDFVNYDYHYNACAGPELSNALAPTLMTLPLIQPTSIQSTAPLAGGEWVDHQSQFSGCQWVTDGAPCEGAVSADRRSVVEHLQRVHGMKPGEEKTRLTCHWEGCNTMLNKESLARHIVAIHLKEKVYCHQCGLYFAREDSLKRHKKGGQHKGSFDKGLIRQLTRSCGGSQ